MNKSGYTYKDSCLAFLFSLIAFLTTSVVFSLIVSSVAASSGQTSSDILSLPAVKVVSSVLSEMAFLLTFVLYTRASKKNIFRDSRLSGKVGFGLGTLVAILSISIVLCSLNFTGMCNNFFATFSTASSNPDIMPLDTFFQMLLGVLVLAILPAVCEELIFRGIILNGLLNKFRPLAAILISAGLFALIHMSIYSTVHQFILGIELGLLLYLTGSLGYCIIFHFFNNLFVVLANYFFKDSFPLEITSWGVVEVIISIGALALGALLTFLFVKLLAKKSQKMNAQQNAFGQENMPGDDVAATNSSQQKVTDKTATIMLVASVIFCMILWITNSFGG